MELRKANSIAAFITFLFSILLLSPPSLSHAVIGTFDGTLPKVSDGDTIKVITEEVTKLKIRLYGYDLPETEKVNRRTGKISKPGQSYGEEAMH